MLDSDKIIIQEGEGYILYSPLGNLKLRILKAKEGYKVFSSNCSSYYDKIYLGIHDSIDNYGVVYINSKGETVEVSDITRLKNSQKETDELINTLCLIASELYNIVEAFIPVTMELRDEPTRTESPFVMLYYTLVKRGLKDIEEVPDKFKEEVKELLK